MILPSTNELPIETLLHKELHKASLKIEGLRNELSSRDSKVDTLRSELATATEKLATVDKLQSEVETFKKSLRTQTAKSKRF